MTSSPTNQKRVYCNLHFESLGEWKTQWITLENKVDTLEEPHWSCNLV